MLCQSITEFSKSQLQKLPEWIMIKHPAGCRYRTIKLFQDFANFNLNVCHTIRFHNLSRSSDFKEVESFSPILSCVPFICFVIICLFYRFLNLCNCWLRQQTRWKKYKQTPAKKFEYLPKQMVWSPFLKNYSRFSPFINWDWEPLASINFGQLLLIMTIAVFSNLMSLSGS